MDQPLTRKQGTILATVLTVGAVVTAQQVGAKSLGEQCSERAANIQKANHNWDVIAAQTKVPRWMLESYKVPKC